jgi:hypothetical protein
MTVRLASRFETPAVFIGIFKKALRDRIPRMQVIENKALGASGRGRVRQPIGLTLHRAACTVKVTLTAGYSEFDVSPQRKDGSSSQLAAFSRRQHDTAGENNVRSSMVQPSRTPNASQGEI